MTLSLYQSYVTPSGPAKHRKWPDLPLSERRDLGWVSMTGGSGFLAVSEATMKGCGHGDDDDRYGGDRVGKVDKLRWLGEQGKEEKGEESSKVTEDSNKKS